MGKTTTTYATIKILKEKGFIKKTLVVCPLRPAYNVWPNQCHEWQQFDDLRVEILHGPNKEAALARDADIYVINPEGLEWLFQPTYATKMDSRGKEMQNKKAIRGISVVRIAKFDVLVVDESTKFKAYDTNRFALLKATLRHFKRRYILTGTITPNGLMDLFGQIYILDEGASLGRYITHYRTKWFYPSGYGGYDWKPQVNARDEISKAIAPLVVQFDPGDHLQLPELLPPHDIFVELPPAAREQYKSMETELKSKLAAGTIVAANAAVASGKCRQIANGSLYTEEGSKEFVNVHDEKLDALTDLIEELSGEPLLIAYQFKFDAVRIAARLKIPSIGSGSVAADMAVIQTFRRGELPAVMGHPETISLGLDGLQDSCHNICWYGLPWNLLHYLQTIDRVRRQGSRSNTVTLHRIIARGTIDEDVLEVLDKKDADQSDFLKLLGKLTQSSVV